MTKEKNITTYSGNEVSVSWDRRLCIHIGECGRAEGELFVGGRTPWCQPDLVQLGKVAEVCQRCPTGALTYKTKEGSVTETAPPKNTVMVAHNGPLYASGDLDVAGAADDMQGVKFRTALCRCGHSKNKPFCDNSHETAGFKDYGAVGMIGDGHDAEGGQLQIKKAPNGPLLLSGNFTILASSGRVAWQGRKTALCRCGESKNKPFCDGAHVAAGFDAE